MRMSDWSTDVCTSDLRWNADVMALTAPKAGKYLEGAVERAALAKDRHPVVDARLQRAIADGVQAPRPAQVRTAAYASADTAQPSRRDSGQQIGRAHV